MGKRSNKPVEEDYEYDSYKTYMKKDKRHRKDIPKIRKMRDRY